MSKLVLSIFFCCFFSRIFSRPAPAVIYSATIENTLPIGVQCRVVWSTPKENRVQSNFFLVKKYSHFAIPEQILDMGSWQARAIIEKIHCAEHELSAPFKYVDSPKLDWKFRITSQGILSVPPKISSE